MEYFKYFSIFITFLYFFDSSLPVDIECDFNIADSDTFGQLYECEVQNILNIISVESARIESALGNHTTDQTNDDVQSFRAYNKSIQYFPDGLGKIFKNLKQIDIEYGYLEELNAEDLKQFPQLVELYLWCNNIQVLENRVFAYTPNLEILILMQNKIIHIDDNVFDHLTKLTDLWLDGNYCSNKSVANSTEKVQLMIAELKVNCSSSELLKLRKEFKKIEDDAKFRALKLQQVLQHEIQSFEGKLNHSEKAFESLFKRNLTQLTHWNEQSLWNVKIELKNSQKELKPELMIKLNKSQESVKLQDEQEDNDDKVIKLILVIFCGLIQIFLMVVGFFYLI